MRTTWKTIKNEIKRGDSVELSRFFLVKYENQPSQIVCEIKKG